MVAFPTITATRQHPAVPGELVTIHTSPPSSRSYTGVFLTDTAYTLGRFWLEIQEQPGKPPLAVMLGSVQRIERHKTLVAPRLGAA